jgi:hypothetical protein
MSEKYVVNREHNYTISIKDTNQKQLIFRDITGQDLEFLERFLNEETELNLENVISILEMLNVSDISLKRIPPRIIKEIFEIVAKEILCNFMTKLQWLEVCYALQNNSFVALSFFESQPMTKIMAMIQVHKKAIEGIKSS